MNVENTIRCIANVQSTVTAGLLLLPFALAAHHSVNAFYDIDDPIAVEGTLTSVRWANPHVQLQMERVRPDGETETWEIDSGGPTLLRRLGVTADLVEVGDRVRISGYPSKHRDKEMIGVSIGLPDGREMPMFPTLASRFGHELRSGVHITAEAAARSERTAHGIFRVWTAGRDADQPPFEPSFTAAALAGRAAYDPLTDDPSLECIPPGMPSVMDNPFPIAFEERGDTIVLKLEIWDVVRTIYMSDDSANFEHDAAPLGHSVGRWEGNTLVVETTDIDWPYFDHDGTPQGSAMHVVERFRLGEAESRLDYELTMTDPETLAEPAIRHAYWVWVPGEALQAYNCTLTESG
jgi:hypothetical protein